MWLPLSTSSLPSDDKGTFAFGPIPDICTSYIVNILFQETLTRAATPSFYHLQCGRPRAIGYHAGTASDIMFALHSRDRHNQKPPSLSASHHAIMCCDRHLQRLLQPL